MSKNTQLTNLVVNGQGDALATLLDHGWIDILDGAQPATGDTAISTQNVLVSLRLATPAFPSTSAGLMTANAITGGTVGTNGTAAWARFYKSDHTTPVMDGSVGTASANVVLPSTTLVAGQNVTASVFTHTLAKATSGS